MPRPTPREQTYLDTIESRDNEIVRLKARIAELERQREPQCVPMEWTVRGKEMMRKLFCTATVFVALCGCTSRQTCSQAAKDSGGQWAADKLWRVADRKTINAVRDAIQRIPDPCQREGAMSFWEYKTDDIKEQLDVEDYNEKHPITVDIDPPEAHTSGPNSPAVTGDGNVINYGGKK